MAVLNDIGEGVRQYSISMAREYELLPDRGKRHLLLQHRTKKYSHLSDKLVDACPELNEVLTHVRDNVSENWYKTIRGRIIGLLLIRCMVYQMSPKCYPRGDLLLYSNWSIVKSYIQRTIKILILTPEYALPNKYYKLQIPQQKLYELSQLFYDEFYEDSVKMMHHYEKLQKKQ